MRTEEGEEKLSLWNILAESLKETVGETHCGTYKNMEGASEGGLGGRRRIYCAAWYLKRKPGNVT